MPEIRPFRGLRFDAAKIGNYDNVITPPFDVISPTDRAKLAARSPYNMVHVILPESAAGEDKYGVAARHLDDWIASGALAYEETPSLYVLEQEFEDQDGRRRTRHAIYGMVKLPEAGERTVLGHERTFQHKINDRLALMRATRANFGAVFALYSDPQGYLSRFIGSASEGQPDVETTTIDGTVQRLWRAPYDASVGDFLRERHFYIADGHHRFATALAYRDEMRAQQPAGDGQPYDYVLMGLVAAQDPGLLVYPAHRVLNPPNGFNLESLRERLNAWFRFTPVADDLPHKVTETPGCAFGLALKSGEQYLLELKDVDRVSIVGDEHGPAWRDLDVAVLHKGILEHALGVEQGAELIYEPDAEKALSYCRDGKMTMAFLLKGVTPGQILACAEAGEYMPQKATYLFPKLPTGAVSARHDRL